VCVIGKFPPIQGGVSMRTYWTAHSLAKRGHDVHVVTNAKEAEPPFRMHMRPRDWKRCGGRYGDGAVTVHWTDPVDGAQSYIPMASPFVSKLAGLAARAHAEHGFDVVYSHYLEPYGVAAHLVSQMARLPHVVRMAGSDAGRLWHHRQLAPLYDHVLQSAATVVAAGTVADRAVARGVDPARIAFGGGFVVPEDVFAPRGPVLDLTALRREVAQDPALRPLLWGDFKADRPYFGICGKLGESKGSFALLAALHRLKRAGIDVGLVALAHGYPSVEQHFRNRARQLGLTDRILQIPFLPHWRVPEFLRGCLAVCCLEQGFPISFHTPIIPFETLLCGRCLIASTEVIRKLPAYGRLPHRYGCVALEDVDDVDALSDCLAAIARAPAPAAALGARAHAYARETQRDRSFPQALEEILEAAAAPRKASARERSAPAPEPSRFPLTQLAASAARPRRRQAATKPAAQKRIGSPAHARHVLATLERAVADGRADLRGLVPAVAAEIAIAAAEDEIDASAAAQADPLFRLDSGQWGLGDDDLENLVPVLAPALRVLVFAHDVAQFTGIADIADLPPEPVRRQSHVVVFGRRDGQRDPAIVDRLTAQILELADGTRTVARIVRALESNAPSAEAGRSLRWIERLFVEGFISLREQRSKPISAKRRTVSPRRTTRRQPRLSA
jgi:glycosyltransferase involved in cell wall biosynthesis